MQSGTVKFYNDQKGYGFIQPDNGGKDVFVHATALERAGMHGLPHRQNGRRQHRSCLNLGRTTRAAGLPAAPRAAPGHNGGGFFCGRCVVI